MALQWLHGYTLDWLWEPLLCRPPLCESPFCASPFPWELPFVWEPLPMGVPSCGKPPSVGTLLLCKPPFCARPPPSVGALFLWKAPSCGRLHSSSRRTPATPVPSLGPFGPREVTASRHCQPLEKSLNQILKIPVTMSSISCWALIAGIPPRLTIIWIHFSLFNHSRRSPAGIPCVPQRS